MTFAQSFDACKAYMTCQFQSSGDPQKRKLPQPFVTISRQVGAGGITVGRKLVEILNQKDKNARCPWTVFDKNLVSAVLEEHHLPQSIADYMPEDKVSELKTIVEELVGLHPSDWALVRQTSETILHLALMGNAVLVGRGANLITRKVPHGFHIRLIGSLPKRIAHLQQYFELTKDEATKLAKKEDQSRKDYLKKHFARDIDDPLMYDAVLNTDHIPYEETAELIARQVMAIRSRILEMESVK